MTSEDVKLSVEMVKEAVITRAKEYRRIYYTPGSLRYVELKARARLFEALQILFEVENTPGSGNVEFFECKECQARWHLKKDKIQIIGRTIPKILCPVCKEYKPFEEGRDVWTREITQEDKEAGNDVPSTED